MPIDPAHMKRRIEERQNLNEETRKLKALEDIADSMLNINATLSSIQVQLQASLNRRSM